MYDLIIIGGGPGGIAAGVYASRKQLNTLFVTKEWGGQSTVSPDIQNWIGTPNISGEDLAKNMENHLKTYAGDFVTIRENSLVTNIVKNDNTFLVTFDNNDTVESRTVLVATGSKRRRLPTAGADMFEHKGITYCATCDGPMFSGQDVVVIGGGNAAFETAAQLLAYTKSVTLLQRGEKYRADPITIEKVLANENMTGILNANLTNIKGDNFVSGLTYADADDVSHDIDTTGIFVEIGMIPNTDFLQNTVELDDYNRIKIDPWTQKTNTEGIWAAGDCTNIKYHQNNISAGDAVKALEDIYIHLKTK